MMTAITKEDFERALPVGVSAHEEVWESVQPTIEDHMNLMEEMILGLPGIAAVEASPVIQNYFKRTVCLSAFLTILRQLDLVLTPTGFGIVNTNNVSPASKQRVDDLEASLRVNLWKSKAILIDKLRSPEWGTTIQAQRCIRYAYADYDIFVNYSAIVPEEVKELQKVIALADYHMRQLISSELMDKIISDYRCGSENDNIRRLRYYFVSFVDSWANNDKETAVDIPQRTMLAYLENKIENFPEYLNSSSYRANHNEPFANSQDSTAFVFNG